MLMFVICLHHTCHASKSLVIMYRPRLTTVNCSRRATQDSPPACPVPPVTAPPYTTVLLRSGHFCPRVPVAVSGAAQLFMCLMHRAQGQVRFEKKASAKKASKKPGKLSSFAPHVDILLHPGNGKETMIMSNNITSFRTIWMMTVVSSCSR